MMPELPDYSAVVWPWDEDPNWAQPREGATYDRGDPANWRLGCGECDLHFPKDIEVSVVAGHWKGHFPSWTEDHQEPGVALNLIWVGLGTPPKSGG